MATEPLFDLKDSWSSAGTQFTGIQLNVTDAASAADSKLLDLQVGGESKFIIYKDGKALIAATLELGVDLAILHGGTGASDAAGARTNLGLGNVPNKTEAEMATAGALADSIKGTSGPGWFRLPNGKMIQFGAYQGLTNSGGALVTPLPTAFANTNYRAIAWIDDSGFGATVSNFQGSGFPSLTQFAPIVREANGSARLNASVRIAYIAIGD